MRGLSPEMILTSMPASVNSSRVVLHAGAQLVAEADEAEGLAAVGQLRRRVAVAEGDRLRPPANSTTRRPRAAQASACVLPGVGRRAAPAPPSPARRARRCRAPPPPAKASPLHLRDDEKSASCAGSQALGRQAPRACASMVRLASVVLAAKAPRSGATRALLGAQRQRVFQLDHARGERAGLVGAEHVDVAQRLDGVELLHEHVLAEQAHGAERVGEGDREDESVGDERQDDGGHAHALDERHAADGVAHPHEDLEDDDHEQQHAHDLVDLPLQRRELALEGGGLGGELVGEARRGRPSRPRSSRRRSCRSCPRAAASPGCLVTRSDSPVSSDSSTSMRPCADHGAVDDHLVAGVQVEEVAEHDLRRVEVAAARRRAPRSPWAA